MTIPDVIGVSAGMSRTYRRAIAKWNGGNRTLWCRLIAQGFGHEFTGRPSTAWLVPRAGDGIAVPVEDLTEEKIAAIGCARAWMLLGSSPRCQAPVLKTTADLVG